MTIGRSKSAAPCGYWWSQETRQAFQPRYVVGSQRPAQVYYANPAWQQPHVNPQNRLATMSQVTPDSRWF